MQRGLGSGNMQNLISIFTPTYNRSQLLKRVYAHLLKQTCDRFEWIIVDDGSSDGTREQVAGWMEENRIRIRYLYQRNMGKHAAHNSAVRAAEGELLVCIDSDDYPTPDCVEQICSLWEKTDPEAYSGVVALKSLADGELLGRPFDGRVVSSTYFDLFNKHRFYGEKLFAYRVDVLRKHYFPQREGLKFFPEPWLYDRIDKEFELVLLNQVLCVCEYQQDGYSANYQKIMIQQPYGFELLNLGRIDIETDIGRIRYCVSRYLVFKWLAKDRTAKYTGNRKREFLYGIPVAVVVYLYYVFLKHTKYRGE